MKTIHRFWPLGVLSLLFIALPLLRAQDEPPPPPPDAAGGGDQGDASFQTFYDQLSDQGQWIQTDDYGYVFQPNVSDPNWAPYTDGSWVDSDQGWTWVSDEPWGWATYHYGRWANVNGCGWVWVPGYQWAPAWVSWRYGGGYCGWAPLPPETIVGAEYAAPGVAVGIGFHFGGDVDVSFNIGAGCYNFCPVAYMGAPNCGRYIVNRYNNYAIINNTTNITNINVNRGGYHGGGPDRFHGVHAGGPPLNEINAHAQQPIRRVNFQEAGRPGRSELNGNSLAIYAPHVNPESRNQARPARVGQTLNHPEFNRGDSINRPLQVTSTVHPAAPGADAVRQAQEAQSHAPAHAKIATERTQVRNPMTTPLSSMAPVTRVSNGGQTPNATHLGGGTQPYAQPGQFHQPTQHSASQVPGQSPYTGGEAAPSHTSPYHQQTATPQEYQPHVNQHVQQPAQPSGEAPPSSGQYEQHVSHHEQTAAPSFAPSQAPQTQPDQHSFHQGEVNHPSSAPASHPQVQQPAGPHTEQHAAPVQQHASAPAPQGGGHPSGGGGGGGNGGHQGGGNGGNQQQGH